MGVKIGVDGVNPDHEDVGKVWVFRNGWEARRYRQWVRPEAKRRGDSVVPLYELMESIDR